MILACFVLFVALTLYCEYSLLRHMGHTGRRSPAGVAYIVLTVLLWLAVAGGVAYAFAGGDTAGWFMRAFGIVPGWFVAFFYTGLGTALALAGIGFLVHYIKRGDVITCPVTKKTRLA